MLLDRLFPRSIYYSLRLAEHSLDELLHRRHLPGRGRPPKRRGCSAGPAASWSSCRRRGLLESLEDQLARVAADLRRGGRCVGLAVLPPHRGLPGPTPAVPVAPSSKREEISMWRMRWVHATAYAYKSPVTASFNEARPTPRSDSRQNVRILNRVETVPPTRQYRYVDYWGTAVTTFDLHARRTSSWRSPRVLGGRDRRASMPRVEPGDMGATWICGGDRPFRRAADLDGLHSRPANGSSGWGQRIAKDHRTAAGPSSRRPAGCTASSSMSPAPPGCTHPRLDAARRQGHQPGLRASDAESCCAGWGIPARYVSGYLHPRRTAKVGDTIEGQSHAWIQAWTGDWWRTTPPTTRPSTSSTISRGAWAATTPM